MFFMSSGKWSPNCPGTAECPVAENMEDHGGASQKMGQKIHIEPKKNPILISGDNSYQGIYQGYIRDIYIYNPFPNSGPQPQVPSF